MTEQAQTAKQDVRQAQMCPKAGDAGKPAISKFVVRMPAELLEKLKHVSRHHNRSMNTELNLMLGHYIEQVKGETRPGVDEHLMLDMQLRHKLSVLSPQKIEALLDLLE